MLEEITSSRLGEKYYRYTHSSGVTVLLYPMKGYSTITAQFSVKFGSIDNCCSIDGGAPVRIPDGTAHYLEHKLFESPEKEAFARFAETGASCNAGTSYDSTRYYFSCSANFEKNLEILLDFVQHPYFTPENVEKERGIITQEITMYLDSPAWRVCMELYRDMFRNNPVRNDIAGSAESIALITDKLLYDVYDAYYDPSNMYLCIAGGFDLESAVEVCERCLLTRTGKNVVSIFEQEPSDGFSGDDEKPQVHLVRLNGSRAELIASTELYPSGIPADRLMYGVNLSALAQGMTGREEFVTASGTEGGKLFLVRKISLPVTSDDVFMVVGIRISALSGAVQEIQALINMFLVGGGVVLVVIFMIIENITAGAVRRLKKSVDRIACGEYNAPIDIRTGDEIEELSKSVRALSDHIVDKTTSLERLNNSYYRFVPLSFLKNLGETQIERVDKSLHSKRRMAVLLLRFTMSDTGSMMESQDIFESVNGVFEQMIPIIGEFSGTAYNFLYNGLSAIFNSADDAVRAAIRIREAMAAYNEVGRKKGRRTADVRVVISEGDVLLGFIGDEKRMEPAAVSGVITEAEEIEKLCSGSSLYIVCTGDAFRTLPQGRYRSRRIGEFSAPGIAGECLYDIFDSDPYALIKLKEQFSAEFAKAVSLFESGDFTAARTRFMDIVKYAPDDGAARNYLYLAEHNINSGRRRLTYRIYDGSEA